MKGTGFKNNYNRVVIVVISVVLLMVCCMIWFFRTFSGLGTIGIAFNYESGFYDEELSVEIKTTGFSVNGPFIIKYNMDGDDLDETGIEYSGGIKLTMPEAGYNLYSISATACDMEQNCIEPVVATYVVGNDLASDVTLGIININCSQYNLYDYYTGIMTGGVTYDLYNESLTDEWYVSGNYNNRGKKWMRDAYIMMFDSDGSIVMNGGGQIGIAGLTSSSYLVKSLSIDLSNEGDNKNGYSIFRLRSGGQDQFSGNIRSSVISRLMMEGGFDGGNITERVVVFLNGYYYGIFDRQMDYSRADLAMHFGLGKEKNVIKEKGSEKTVFEEFGLGEEIWDNIELLNNMERLEKIVDMDDFLKYYAIQILINNTDWPMNNYTAWRYKGRDDGLNKYKDGKLRFLLRDTDLTYYTDENTEWFEGAIGDIFEYLMEEKYSGDGSVFRKVMESEYYRNRFIEILRELINGPFRTENVLKIIDEEAAKIDHQVELWSTPEEYGEWKYWIEVLRGAAASREQEVRDGVFKYFGVVL